MGTNASRVFALSETCGSLMSGIRKGKKGPVWGKTADVHTDLIGRASDMVWHLLSFIKVIGLTLTYLPGQAVDIVCDFLFNATLCYGGVATSLARSTSKSPLTDTQFLWNQTEVGAV